MSADKLAQALRLAIKEMDWLPTSDETKKIWMRQQEVVIKLEAALAAHQAERPAAESNPLTPEGRRNPWFEQYGPTETAPQQGGKT